MSTLKSLIRMHRAKKVIEDIRDGVNRLMPCGDSRLATQLGNFGAIILINRKKREYTASWKITELGEKCLNEC